MRNYKLAIVATTALVGSLFATGAFAQSTGTAEVEEVVITGTSGPKNLEGAIVAETAAKSKSTLTDEFIQTQVAGQTVLQTLNILPSVNFTSNDAYGGSGGDVTIRGFDSQRISLNVDGIQLNDTGNYAIYSNQQLDPELISRVSTNLGTTDVDSPTASATGGTINYVTRRPATEFGGILQPSIGDDGYGRIFGLIDTGEIGPWGTRAFFAASYTKYDKFRGPGELEKKQFNGGIYQPLGDNGDFVSVTGHWNENRNNFFRRINIDNFNNGIIDPEYNDKCYLVGSGAGRQDDGSSTAVVPGDATTSPSACSNYYGLNINPSNTGNIRGQSRFSLGESFTLTVDPTFQYVMANGGGSTTINEYDARLAGSFYDSTNSTTRVANGVDLNGDGDILDRIRLYSPSNTNTRRYSVTSSLIWEINDTNRLRVAYTYDYGRHRQTGEYSKLSASGDPRDVFSGKDGYGTPVRTKDGEIFQKRDRFSIAILNQIALQYVGRFFDDALTVDVGVRAPFFKRELNNYCYQQDTFNAYCGNLTPAEADIATDGSTPNPAPGAPVAFERKYDKVLPNLGVTYRFLEGHSVYFNYSENLSAPRTDDLYDRIPADPEPETSKQYDLGYRYSAGPVILSASGFISDFDNYIIRAITNINGEDLATSINVGKVERWGIDGQIGWEVVENLNLYASYAFVHSEFKDDVPGTSVGSTIRTAGKQLPEVPERQFAARAQYKIAGFTIGLQTKWVDERFTNAINDERVPSYQVWDADVRYDLPWFNDKGAYLQLNVTNLLDEEYIADISTDIVGNRTGNLGAPKTVQLTLRAPF
ncbi:TonB-dependent receptor [Caulobacter sp. NIBR1757]|uniref:TonB-dependent receptor n=1 Tax=Caulobacter sp. NIBR1757 TaxID=3016000 RepID=UPI0022F00B6E|nr:TonB-dependent receptor [Caulobacter sp. NIBR1757]WGM37802.1 Vitamin B12 transporter BtuB [Caulobacter sp. NIBR1757]